MRAGWWRRYGVAAGVVLLLGVMVVEVGLSTRQESPSWDEGDHIYSGYMNWKHGEYTLNPEHPPLVKLVATLPLLGLDLKVAPRLGRFFKDEAYYGGRELLFRNDPQYGGRYGAATLLFRVHMAVLVFGLGLALLVFFAGREMFGAGAGLLAMTLFVLDPTVLTNAPFVTTDMGASWGYFAGVYTFYRFAKRMGWGRAVLCGVAVGLAIVTKHSVAALPLIVILLGVGEVLGRWRMARVWPGAVAGRMLAGLVVIGLVAWGVIWGVYGFRYAMHPVGITMPPLARQMEGVPAVTQAVVRVCTRFHLLPESYVYGMVDVQRVGVFMPMYFLGKVYAHGLWYYFPVLLSLKWTIGVLGLLGIAVWAMATGKVGRPREVFFLAFPPLMFLGVAMASPLNIGVRHVLPVFAFVFVLAAGGVMAVVKTARRPLLWGGVVAGLVAWHAVDSVRMFPNYLPYANAFWGGPTKTNRYFSDSVTDWAQQLVWTKRWTDTHQVHECWIAYFAAPFLLPSDYGIPCKLLPTPDTEGQIEVEVPAVVHGPVLVSYGTLNGFELGTKVRNPYQKLFERKPDDVIANGIAVYEGHFALPDARAMEYVDRAAGLGKTDPQGAVAAARAAVAASPRGFDANLALGDALARVGDKAGARAAYDVVEGRLGEMEPSARVLWAGTLRKKMAAVQ